MPRILRRAVATALSSALIILSVGFDAQRAAAQTLTGRAVPVATVARMALPASSLKVPSVSEPSIIGALPLLLAAAVAPAPVAAPALSAAASTAKTAQAIAPALKVIADSKASIDDQQSASRRIDDAILGKRDIEAEGGVSAVSSDLQSARAVKPLAAHGPRRLTETTFVVFDIETTGLNAEINRTTQIGAVKIRLRQDGTIKILDKYEQLVDPQVPVPAEISDFGDIIDSDLKGQPTLDKVLPGFAAFVGKDSILLAHNAPFDTSFLGYQMRALGLPVMPQLVLDTKDIARSLFPGLKSYSVTDLILAFGLGSFEEHQGLSDAMKEAAILALSVKQLALAKGKAIADLSFDDLAAHSDKLHFDSVLERLDPLPLPGAARPIGDDFQAEVARRSRELHVQGKPAMLRDIALAMGVDYAALRDKMREAALRVPVAEADEILADLKAHPPAAVFTDYDNTLTDRGGDSVSLPTSKELIRAIEQTLKKGIPVVITSARNFKYQPPEMSKPDSKGLISYEIYKTLISRIAPALRGNLFFAGSLGGEVVLFDAKGKAIPYVHTVWDMGEKESILTVVDKTLAELGIDKSELTLSASNPNQINLIFKVGDEARAKAFGVLLRQRFKENDILYPVLSNRQWVYFSKYKKSDASRMMYAILKAKGYPVTPKNILFLGDEFNMNKGMPMGGDATMAMPFPDSRAVSVGDKPGDTLAPNVRRLGIRGSRGSLRVFETINGAAAARSKPEAAPAKSASGFFSRPIVKMAVSALAGAAAVLALPWLVVNATIAGTVGGLILTAIGIPQIITNIRLGSKATKDQSLSSYLIWFGAAAFLTATSLIKHSSPLWILSNVAGVVESAILAVQVNRNSPRPGHWKKTVLAVAAVVAVAAALTGSALFFWPAASVGLGWAAFAAAVALLYALDVPQIRMNYDLWQASKRVPDGANPLMPGLVALGSLISVMAAFALGDALWMVNSLIAIVMSSIVLSQIFLPAAANAVLGPVVKTFRRLALAARRLLGR